MSDGNTVPLTQPAPVAPQPVPVPAVDSSTTQVITPDVLAGLVPSGAPVVPVPPAVDAVTAGAVNPGAAHPGVAGPGVVDPGVAGPGGAGTGVVDAAPAAPDPTSTQVVTPEAGVVAGTPNFASVAQADLQKATTALGAVDKQNVQLDLDKQAVRDLVRIISQARDLVDNVRDRAVNNLDVELQFGNNWVGEAIGRRLREVAVGNDASAVSVIGDFMQVLLEVEETIREAARNLEEADDDAADTFSSAGVGEVKGP
ncbi:hypothetical protein FHS29_005499 [Saccharothrix tamanrassetensis]|uniref:Uncharacterized protein n=1 Tax=Saccharothrix tamanrassetensis TaxID=1051531 RepID=A0A841CNZ5_9PSEU|nr:hypothetical protein [Saccharothrix tamanrassetensis]MBB5958890.1 hypothetical protein [Saccharothrix tamanrassetensis]